MSEWANSLRCGHFASVRNGAASALAQSVARTQSEGSVGRIVEGAQVTPGERLEFRRGGRVPGAGSGVPGDDVSLQSVFWSAWRGEAAPVRPATLCAFSA
jgi:hypothetical protein